MPKFLLAASFGWSLSVAIGKKRRSLVYKPLPQVIGPDPDWSPLTLFRGIQGGGPYLLIRGGHYTRQYHWRSVGQAFSLGRVFLLQAALRPRPRPRKRPWPAK